MKKKYIIEKGDKETIIRVYVNGDGKADFTQAYLAPYTEPDLEQVRKEAYQKGLSDAWEAARNISTMDSKTRDEIFGLVITSNIVDENTASEAIEKIRQYEQGQEEQIQVWDEVINERNFKGAVTDIEDDGMLTIFCQDGTWIKSHARFWKKTGRHFPEIAEVLQKMRKSQ